MRYWIETTSDYQWSLRLNATLGLNAPASTRYKNMLKNIEYDDVILHYITTQGAACSSHRSVIIGISKIASEMQRKMNMLIVILKDTVELPVPIKFNEYSIIEKPSKKFKFLLKTNLQRYITEIEKEDMLKIVNLNQKNIIFLKNNSIYQRVIEI